MRRPKHTHIANERQVTGNHRPVYLTPAERRRHFYAVGKTGSGKTTLVRNLALQDIAAGRGVGLIDPHGDLAEELLDHVPGPRVNDVAYINPADVEHPVAINLLESTGPDQRHLVAASVVEAFKNIWADSWGPRLEYILYNAAAALADYENSTLLGILRMLKDQAYRQQVVAHTTDPVVRQFWTEEFAGYDDRFRAEAISPIQNKVGRFLANAPIRNILGQVKSTIDPRFIFDDGRILIVNLAKGKIGSDKAKLLGALLVARLQVAAMARADQPEEERRDFFLHVDEFHNFTTRSFATALSEARKYGLGLTLAHQYTDQLDTPTRQAVFGNVGTLVSFRVGSVDARRLAEELGTEVSARALSDLRKYEAYIKRPAGEFADPPVKAQMLPPIEQYAGRREQIIRHSRDRFGRRRAVVEDKIERFMQAQADERD